MKLVIRMLSSFLVAAIAFVMVITITADTLVPVLTEHVSKTFPSNRNLEISSSVGADPDPGHADPVNGEKYEVHDYVYTYEQSLGGWKVEVKDNTKEQYNSLCESIYGAPVVSLNSTFVNCAEMKAAPAVPKHVKDVKNAFSGCAALSGLVTVYANPTTYDGCFDGTKNTIELAGDSTVLASLCSTSAKNNVKVK